MTKQELEAAQNEDAMKLATSNINRQLAKIYEGGGAKRLEKQRSEGKMTTRERVNFLLDDGKPQIEIGAFAGYDLYPEYGGCPAAGVIVVIGYIKGKQCIVVANDATANCLFFRQFVLR